MDEFLGFSETVFDSCVPSERINLVRKTLEELGSQIEPELQKLNEKLHYVVSRAKRQGSHDFNSWAWLMFTNAPIGPRGKPLKAYEKTQLTVNASNKCIYVGLNLNYDDRDNLQKELDNPKNKDLFEEIITILSNEQWIITRDDDDFSIEKPKVWEKNDLRKIILDPELDWINARYDRSNPNVKRKEISKEIIRVFKILYPLYALATNSKLDMKKIIIVDKKEETIEIRPQVEIDLKPATELKLIELIHETISDSGFTFSNQQLINYYISLKTKPFVILTGISGTGKTKITELFAKAVCEDFEKQYLLLPVRPDWNDDKYLLGYYNPLTKKYQSTPFLEFIMQAKQDRENPYFVCLDEMNLARVEYYFSTFLSAMESNKKIKLHSETDIKTESGKEISSEIEIPPNLFFTGTVNMDETTYRFSPKVLDRANTIEFTEIELLKPRENENSSSDKPDLVELFKRYFLKDEVRTNGITSNIYRDWENKNWNDLSGFLDSMNKDSLEKNNLHFGYRIRDEILRYEYFAEKLGSSDFTIDTALDFQIKQKILPRIKGPESIRPSLESLRDKLAGKYLLSSAKINQMLEALQNGYTDFYQ